MARKRLQVFQTSQIRVTYDPTVCQHSDVCVHSLKRVFDRSRDPWVTPGAAPPEEIIAAVAKCPSGALRAQLVTSVFRTKGPADER
jgi:uncharacterized Fe-S cluster protein YjdI